MIWPKSTLKLFELFQCQDGAPEVAAIFFLGDRGVILETHFFEGSSHGLEIPVTAILRHSLDLLCRQLLLVHTHPTGNPHPSARDMDTTRKICISLRRQSQRLMDHIILSKERYFSFRCNGLI